jgi:segregation and condensation protein B
LAAVLPEDTDAAEVLRAVQARYAGRGVELAEIGGGWQFRTAADLAPRLTRVITRPRRLPRVALETLAIIAWHQPVTRAQIEEIRGTALSQQTVDTLLEASLVRTAGHREVPGRPILWATTPEFLTMFGLKDLKDLPRREELVLEQDSGVGSQHSAISDADVADYPAQLDPVAAVGYQPSEESVSDD